MPGRVTASGGRDRAGVPAEDGIYPGSDTCAANSDPLRHFVRTRRRAADPFRVPSGPAHGLGHELSRPPPGTVRVGSVIVRPCHAVAHLPLVNDVGRAVGLVAQLPAKSRHVRPQQL